MSAVLPHPAAATGQIAAIHESLSLGDIEAAYDRFEDWARREAWNARAGRPTNLPELMQAMLELMNWMYPRVRREVAALS